MWHARIDTPPADAIREVRARIDGLGPGGSGGGSAFFHHEDGTPVTDPAVFLAALLTAAVSQPVADCLFVGASFLCVSND